MAKKKLYFFFMFLFHMFLSGNIIDELEKIKEEKQLENKNQKKIILENDLKRISNVLEIFEMSKRHQSITEITKMFDELCKEYLGINTSYREKYLSKENYIDKILESINEFNISVSSDIKYLCDMKIKYILENKKIILNKIKKSTVYKIIITSYLGSQLLPYEMPKNTIDEYDIENSDVIEKNYQEEDAKIELMIELHSLGSLKENFLFKEFEENILDALNNNQLFYDCSLLKNSLIKKIEKDENSLTIFEEEYKSLFLKNNIKIKDDYKEKLHEWLFEKENIEYGINNVFNYEVLFFFSTIIRITESLKITKNRHYNNISNEECLFLEDINKYLKLFFKEFNQIFNIKKKNNWENMNPIIISEKRIKKIIKYLQIITLKE